MKSLRLFSISILFIFYSIVNVNSDTTLKWNETYPGGEIIINETQIEDEELYELFWIFFPEARNTLHKAKVFNPENNSQPITFDHLLNARRFNSVIVREENIYGNRKISDYIRGNSLFQLLEASRIKENIRNREIDMWNY